jgi:hypothetical protein
MYVASARIELAKMDGQFVDHSSNIVEKMKLPLYFSTPTLKVCGSDGDLESRAKFFERIKPYDSKFSNSEVNFVTKAQSTKEAKDCLNAVIEDVTRKQDAIIEPNQKLRKKRIQELNEQLDLYEEIANSFPATKGSNNSTNAMLYARILNRISGIRLEISELKPLLQEPNTRSVSLVTPVYSSEVPVNKQPLFTLGLCLSLGVFWGMLVTWVMREAPKFRLQMREAEVKTK